ncbi:MAG TPA: radical SAM protein [Thermoplasmata archaeon]|nr:radical SAM protein [Thermoplasmata archaeon]
MRKLPKRRFLEVAGQILRNKMAREAIYPFYCSFKLTRRCNFTCSFCNCWHVKNRWKDMPTEDVKAVLDNLARSSVIVCSFEGGDPLVRDDIGELLRYQYEKPWYLLFTTSERDMEQRYPMPEYGKYIDFLHISIDEGHKNLDMYDDLEEYTKWGSIVTVQIVVTKNDVGALEQKIKRCHDAGVKAVVMCAVHLKNTKDHLPDLWQMSRVGMEMKKKYPGVIISPDGYFDRITWDHGCDTSSIIVDADGFLWYPCRVLEEKTINLIDSDLMTYLESPDARERRQRMAACDIQCAWYQYYATQSFVNPRELLSAWMPYYRDLLNGGKQPTFAAPAFAPKDPRDLIHSQILQESAMKGLDPVDDGLVHLPTLEPPTLRP